MNRDEGTLKHISIYIADIESFVMGLTYEQFINDRKTMQAVCYAILNIGELSKVLSEEVRRRNPNIPWKQIIGMRDRAAHGYHLMSPEIVWDVAKFEMHQLKQVIDQELLHLQNNNC